MNPYLKSGAPRVDLTLVAEHMAVEECSAIVVSLEPDNELLG